jgi:hypothetical protein
LDEGNILQEHSTSVGLGTSVSRYVSCYAAALRFELSTKVSFVY